MRIFVIDEAAVEPSRDDGDTAETRITFDRSSGCERLEQRVVRFAAGRSRPRTLDWQQELLYVVSGQGTLRVDGSNNALEPEMGAFLASGETYEVDNPGPDAVVVVAVVAPQERAAPADARRVTVRFADLDELVADENRTFRYLVNEDVGCTEATQFLGLVKPCRAPVHSHPYDEVGYIVEGRGLAHVGGVSTPIGPGSCFHLPPQEMHCIENSGPGVMRILGDFHPSGSPASRTYGANQSGGQPSNIRHT
jgi:mannose-6-phosphate isomerase-like protein (cupin superfamily)